MWVLSPVELQESVVHVKPSSHVIVVPTVQVPVWQESFCVHPSLSKLHRLPSVLSENAVWEVAGMQAWH